MAYREGHGNGRGVPRIEVLPPDEQPRGVPAPTRAPLPPEPDGIRKRSGQFVPGEQTRAIARRGGLASAAKAKQLRALDGLGLRGTPPKSLRPYLDEADAFCRAEVERLARECGGGVCPPNACALMQQAALAMAASRAAYAKGDLALGAKLGAEVRSCLLGARELCVREAQSRPDPDDDARDEERRAFQRQLAARQANGTRGDA